MHSNFRQASLSTGYSDFVVVIWLEDKMPKEKKSLYSDKSNIYLRRQNKKMNSKVDDLGWGHYPPV